MPVSTYDKYNSLKEFLSGGLRTLDECVMHMGQNKRTVYRAIEALRKEPGFRTVRNYRPIRFTMEDSSAKVKNDVIKNLENVVKKSSGSATEERLTAPIQKIIRSLQQKNENSAQGPIAIPDDLIIDLGPTADCNFNNELFKKKYEKCLFAIRNHQKMRIHYTRTSTGKTESFLIKPCKMIMRIDTLYLYAAKEEHNKEEMELFVFNQIERIQYLSETFEPIKVNTKDIYRYAFAKWIPDTKKLPPTEIVLEATTEWAAQLFKRFNFGGKKDSEFAQWNEKKYRLELNLSITPDFKSWLFGMLDSIKIVKPASLKKDAKLYLQEALEKIK